MSPANVEWVHRQEKSDESRREYERERLKLWTMDSLAELMESCELSKAECARQLGTSRANITQLFSGSKNVTLSTLADLAWACGRRVSIDFEPLRSGEFISSPVRLVTASNRTVRFMPPPSREAGRAPDYSDLEVLMCAGAM